MHGEGERDGRGKDEKGKNGRGNGSFEDDGAQGDPRATDCGGSDRSGPLRNEALRGEWTVWVGDQQVTNRIVKVLADCAVEEHWEDARGATYLDRTTLTPDAFGNVRQHIEISTDGGESWRTAFDAEYRPAG